jgi:hypothetical protein
MANCFWDDYEGHRKLHLANWHMICMKKEHGGLGVPNLKDFNLCLLGFWVKRYIKYENKIWRRIVIVSIAVGVAFFMQIRMELGYRWSVGNGRKVLFWEDTWFGTAPLAVQF